MIKKQPSLNSAGSKSWGPIAIKKLVEDLMKNINEDSPVRLRRLDNPKKRGINVQFYCESAWSTAPTEEYMLEVAAWCAETKCGKRTSFDQFRFKNEQEYMMFMLRWQ